MKDAGILEEANKDTLLYIDGVLDRISKDSIQYLEKSYKDANGYYESDNAYKRKK